jgi:hypothetical protein
MDRPEAPPAADGRAKLQFDPQISYAPTIGTNKLCQRAKGGGKG